MIRRILTALFLSALLATGLSLVGPTAITAPASAAITKNGCATRAEWRAVKRGTTLAKARRIIDHRGRLVDETQFSDGDEYRTYKFRQCRRSWGNSYLYLNVGLTEYEDWVDTGYWDPCYDFDWDYNCVGGWVDDGYWETFYSTPFRVQSKNAYWS